MSVVTNRDVPASTRKLVTMLFSAVVAWCLFSLATQTIAQVPGGTGNCAQDCQPSSQGTIGYNAGNTFSEGGTMGASTGGGVTPLSWSPVSFSWSGISMAPNQVLSFVGAVFGLVFAFFLLLDSSRLQLSAKLGELGPIISVLLAFILVSASAVLWVFARFTQGGILYYGGDANHPALLESLVMDFARSPRAYAEAVGVLAIFPTAVAFYQFISLWREVPEGASLGVLVVKTMVTLVGFAGSIVTLLFTSYHWA